jgi:hypothetical protein
MAYFRILCKDKVISKMNEKYWTILEDTILRIIDERRIDCGIKKDRG